MNEAVVKSQQFSFLSILDDNNVGRVFHTTPVKKGEVEVGVNIVLKNAKELKAEFPDKNKTELAELVMESQDRAWNKVKGEVASLGPEWSLHKVTRRNLAGGVQQLTIIGRKYSAKQQLSDERVAKAWFPSDQYPSMTLEEKVAKIRAMRESQQAELKAKEAATVNVETTETKPETAVDEQKPQEPTQAEKDEAELARMLAEEEQAQAQDDQDAAQVETNERQVA